MICDLGKKRISVAATDNEKGGNADDRKEMKARQTEAAYSNYRGLCTEPQTGGKRHVYV